MVAVAVNPVKGLLRARRRVVNTPVHQDRAARPNVRSASPSRIGAPRGLICMTLFLRIGLFILFLDELVVGAWNAISPWTFYRHFPTVDLSPPFSEHYAKDFGEATLGIALLLLIALWRPKAHYVIPAALAFLVFAVPHFFFHVTHLEGFSTGQTVFVTTANAIVALLGIAVVLVAVARERRDRRG